MNKLPTLVCLGVLTFLSFSVQAQIVNPAISASMERDVTLPQRDVRRLLNEAQRVDLIEQEREIRRQAKEAVEKAIPPFRGQVSPGGEFLFVRTKRNQKCAGGAGAEELQAPRARFRSKRLHPRIPDLRGIRIRGACAAFRR